MQRHTESTESPGTAPGRDQTPGTRPPHTKQTELDELERHKHEKSENDLPTSQDKNPVPPGSTGR
jgi:hypothetical protein